MQKIIYLIRGSASESYSDFSARIFKAADELKTERDLLKLRVVFTGQAPPFLSVIPFRRSKAATISVTSGETGTIGSLQSLPGFAGAYKVTEVLPVAYQKTWKDGEQTPGTCLLTLFTRKKGLDTATFLDRWHNSHTPLSLKIHPLWNYNRNVVDQVMTTGSETWEGIVEEQTRTDSDLLNPFKFFGNPLVIIQRMIAVYTDTKSFLDYGGIQTYFAREIIVKSATFVHETCN